ncbi:uncharacterized protein [Diadema antillarum]|uniref:uncharacterized protein n=1 Tax=Diadema antillarum TaxID=105358 RepID=UPI003A876ACD
MAPTIYPLVTENGINTSDPANPGSGVTISCSWADSSPNWTLARETLGYGLQVHTYLFAAVFAVIFLYTVCIVVQTMRGNQARRRLGLSLHAMVALATIARAVSLFIDPYGSRKLLPCPINVIIWSLGWPSIIASHSIFFLAVLETTKLSIASPRFQRLSTLAVIIIVSLAYVIFADLLVSYMPSTIISILLCELLFIIWGVALTAGFVFAWRKIRRNLSASHPRNKSERRRSSMHGSVASKESEVRRVNRLIAIFLCSAGVCFLLTLSHLPPVIAMFHRRIIEYTENPWQWWGFETGQRTLELAMCILILVAMVKPSDRDREDIPSGSKKLTVVSREMMENDHGIPNDAMNNGTHSVTPAEKDGLHSEDKNGEKLQPGLP